MSESLRSRLSRRQVFAAAGTAGALAAVAAAVPLAQQAETKAQPKPAPDKGGGYHVTQHVLRYYQTTKI